MSTTISNPSADRNEKIVNAINVIGRSFARKKVFEAIYLGKTKQKTVSVILKISGLLNRVRVLQEADTLAQHDIIKKLPERLNNETVYEKIGFYQQNKKTILSAFGNSKKRDNISTRSNPKITLINKNSSTQRKRSYNVSYLTIDDIDSFSIVKKIKTNLKSKPVIEEEFKKLIQKIIGENGVFKDWGGERNDLYSSRVILNGKRTPTSFAFKGKGKKGTLKPNMMGKNGDQIQRLFSGDSTLYVLQYYDQIDQSVDEMMNTYAIKKSISEQKKIYYCIIDGIDTQRIIKAYK